MKLEEVSKVKILTSEEEINNYLSKGYKIIKVFSSKIHTDQVEQILASFILGKKE